MRKKYVLFFVLFFLTACGNEENKIYGTWKVDYIEKDGSKFTVEEWEKVEYEDFSSMYIIFKEGGQAYLYEDGYDDLVNWLYSKNEIMIGEEKVSYLDNKIIMDYYGDKIYLKKESNSQEIPKEDITENDESETTEKDDSIESDWKEFLIEYEKWVDDYVELTKKYNENPSDISILNDYTDMTLEMSEWNQKIEEIEIELKDTSDALQYTKEILRIANKLIGN